MQSFLTPTEGKTVAEKRSPAKAKGDFRKEIPLAKRGKRASSSMRNAVGKSHGRHSKGNSRMDLIKTD